MFEKLIRGPPRDHSDFSLLISIRKQVTSYVFAQILLLFNRLLSIFQEKLHSEAFWKLKHWQENKKKKGISRDIHDCDREQITFLCECAFKIITGNIPMNVYKLLPFEQQLKILCQPQKPDRRRRPIITSIKGYKLFKLISRPCICKLSAE